MSGKAEVICGDKGSVGPRISLVTYISTTGNNGFTNNLNVSKCNLLESAVGGTAERNPVVGSIGPSL